MRIGRLLIAVVVGLSGSQAAGAVELYGALGSGVSFTHADSGGTNFFGPHENTGDDSDVLAPITGAFGVALMPEDLGFAGLGLRLELAGAGNYAHDFTTNSFEPPTPTFFYETDVEAWTAMANLWLDVPIVDPVGVYVGGGVGIARVSVETTDEVVSGDGSDTNFAWTAGAGLTWRVAPWAVLDLGYRYVDLGESSVELRDFIGSSVPPSDLTLDMHSHQILTTFRISIPAGWVF